jgi:tetratricopeptide (TPR) repeat protein
MSTDRSRILRGAPRDHARPHPRLSWPLSQPALSLLLAVGALVGSSACAGRSKSPYATPTDTERSPRLAERLTLQAVEIATQDPARAEALLKEALENDLYHGPAHNNLGVVYLRQARLYEAAGEFEWARKLLPGHPDPRRNLALTLERAGRTDDAIAAYRTALEVYPDHLPTIQALTRLQLRAGKPDDATPTHLQTIALRGDPTWQHWARLQLSKAER